MDYLQNQIDYLESLNPEPKNEMGLKLQQFKDIQEKLEKFKVFDKIKEWATERDLIVKGNEANQAKKTIEEVAEMLEVIDQNGTNEEYASESGGIMVTVVNGQFCRGIDPIDSLNLEFNRISKRKGEVLNGKFVKEGKSNSKRKGYELLIRKTKELLRIENVKDKVQIMKFNVKVDIFGQIIRINNVIAENEFDAENKAKKAINKAIKYKATIVKECRNFDSDFFGFFNMK